VPSSSRTSACTAADARTRLKTARDEYLNVAAGLAVLAGIAASDSICCARLKVRHRGDDHRGAADLLRTATPDGANMARLLLRLLDLKDEAHYGVMVVAARKANNAVRWARTLADRAGQEVER
jgi:hypothetical protein